MLGEAIADMQAYAVSMQADAFASMQAHALGQAVADMQTHAIDMQAQAAADNKARAIDHRTSYKNTRFSINLIQEPLKI